MVSVSLEQWWFRGVIIPHDVASFNQGMEGPQQTKQIQGGSSNDKLLRRTAFDKQIEVVRGL